MIAAAGLSAELQVAGDLAPFALGADAFVTVRPGIAPVVDVAAVQERFVLAMRRDDAILPGREGHRLPHHPFPLDAAAVIREGAAAVPECGHVHQFPAFPALGDGAVGEYLDDGVPVDGGLLDGQGLGTVGHRVEIGHRADRGIAAGRCGLRAAAYRFLGGEARFPEMDMDVGESRADQLSAAVQQACVGCRQARSDGGDAPFADKNVPLSDALRRTESASFQYQVSLHARPKNAILRK